MTATKAAERTCIIVVELNKMDMQLKMGIVVDSVSEVLNIGKSEIEETPSFGTNLDTAFILGMTEMEGGVKILLDIDRTLTEQETQALHRLS